MSPNRRERAYEKRRYEKWQSKQAERAVRRRQVRRTAGVVSAALVVVLVAGGIVFFFTHQGKSSTPSAATTASPTTSASASPTHDPNNPCPAPTVKPPAKPKTFTKPAAATAGAKPWTLNLTTSCGQIGLALDGAKAPQATAVMLELAKGGFFDGSPCHRLTTSGIYVLQCGDPTGTGTGGPGFDFGPVENAPKNDVYPAGTVAMARQGDNANSNGSQFFLVYKDSTIPHDTAGGYTVLGTIKSGLDVVTKVADGGVSGGSGDGAPARPISIVKTAVTPG